MSQDTTVFDIPRAEDRERLAELLVQDMATLKVHKTQEEMARLVDLVLEDAGRTAFCRVVRPAPGELPVGLVLGNLTFSVKFAGRALWIENLYVDPAWRRGKMGRRLLGHLLDWAEAHGIKGIDLEAYQGNTPASILYRSLGFERLNRERFWFDFGWLDELPSDK